MKKIHIVIVLLFCIATVGVVFCKRPAKRVTKKASFCKVISLNPGQETVQEIQMKDVVAASSSDQPRQQKGTDTQQAGKQRGTQVAIAHESANAEEASIACCEGIILACKAARESEMFQKKTQALQNDVKDVCIEFVQEAANNMNAAQKNVAGELVTCVEMIINEFSDFFCKLREPGLTKAAEDKLKLEFQVKFGQLMLSQASKFEALSKAIGRHPEVGDV